MGEFKNMGIGRYGKGLHVFIQGVYVYGYRGGYYIYIYRPFDLRKIVKFLEDLFNNWKITIDNWDVMCYSMGMIKL